MHRSFATVGACALALVGLATLGGHVTASAMVSTSEHVSPTGVDTGNCVSSPCATINYAISVAPAGETIKVAAGTYNQTVEINKPVNVIGAGASSTTIDGSGLDPSASGFYGVVYIGNGGSPIGGVATLKGFTITNPYPFSYTGGEPMDVVIYGTGSGDRVNVQSNTLTEGTYDANAGTDFPIGIDTFVSAAPTTISGNTISGFFQGLLLEDNGPASVSRNIVENLISGTDNSTSPATVYPAEGLFFLADEGGTYSGQNATGNTFTGYAGDGIDEDAGYTGGYVTTDCLANGSITTTLQGNSFALGGTSGANGINLNAVGAGNSLTGTVSNNHGYVTSPSNAMEIKATNVPPTPDGTSCSPYSNSTGGAGSLDVVTNYNPIAVHAASSTAPRAAGRAHLVHVPALRG